jgi:hypothetical protein
MSSQRETPAGGWKAGDSAEADATLDEVLRQIDADILDEPVPEKLRRILHGEQGVSDQDSPSGGDAHRTRHR